MLLRFYCAEAHSVASTVSTKRCSASCAEVWRSMGRKRPPRWWHFRAGWVL